MVAPILIPALEDKTNTSELQRRTALARKLVQPLFFEENVPNLM
jgi:hypothetical protein